MLSGELTSAQEKIERLNPEVHVEPISHYITAANALETLKPYDFNGYKVVAERGFEPLTFGL